MRDFRRDIRVEGCWHVPKLVDNVNVSTKKRVSYRTGPTAIPKDQKKEVVEL